MNSPETHPSTGDAEAYVLVMRYFDHAITPEEAARLEALLLRDDSVRRLFRDLCLQALVISECERGAPAAAPGRPPRRAVIRSLIVITAVAAALLVLALSFSGGATPIGHFEEILGDVRLVTAGGAAEIVKPGVSATSDVTVLVRGDLGSATFRFLDGSRVILAGNTTVTLRDEGQKRVSLHGGNLGASVEPQPPNRPMQVVTPHAVVEVLGTRFYMATTAHDTGLGVVQGRVAARRASDANSVTVGEREFAITDGRSELRATELALPPFEARWTFDRGSADGWTHGRHDAERGTMTAVRKGTQDDPNALHEAASGAHWTRGVFLVSEDSVLTFRYRFRRPGRFYLMIGTRSEDTQTPATGNFEIYDRSAWDIPANTWRTARIPLQSLRRTRPPHVPPWEGLVAYFIAFNTLRVDRGLEIDWVQITRDSRGQAPR